MQQAIKKIKNYCVKIKDLLLNLILPCFCIGCGKEGLYICQNCAKNLKTLIKKQRPLCVYSYESRLVKDMLYAFKYDGIKSLDQTIARLMYDFLMQQKYSFDAEWIISFVPMHKTKLEIRGFNQSELLAKSLARLLNLKCCKTLEKTRKTIAQMQLNRNERLVNLNGAFAAGKNIANIATKKIILIDDVCTTGATLAECKKTLLQAGVRRVLCIAFAKD
jgi:competence protein ComFC